MKKDLDIEIVFCVEFILPKNLSYIPMMTKRCFAFVSNGGFCPQTPALAGLSSIPFSCTRCGDEKALLFLRL
jgi:hypothetical protein